MSRKLFMERRSPSWSGTVKQLCSLCTTLLVAFSLLSGVNLFAQYDSATISGTVRDQNGAALGKATIQIQNRDTGLVRSTLTNSTGTYNLSQIPPGVYKITASMSGFSSASREGVDLAVSQSSNFDFSLTVGAVNQTVAVSANAVELQTSSATVGATLETNTVNSLPLNGRNYSGLLLLQTGVTPINNEQTGGRTNAVGDAVYPSIQGQNNRSNTYLLDGVNNNESISGSQTITPIPDDIQELKVQTHNDFAQFGGAVGGIINVITKSGTNQFHGAAWEYWRGSQLFDARPITGVLPNLHQNQFGGAVGGPVLLPHYNGKNRTFFYVSYEGFRQSVAQSTFQLVPTPAEYNGDFSSLLAGSQPIQLYNPYSPTRAPFQNNQIPQNLLDQNMVKLAQTLFPAPTGSYLGATNYLNTTPETHNSNQYDLRGDEYLGDKNQIWAHYLHQTNPTTSYAGIPGLLNTTGYVAHNFGAEWIHTFGPNSVLTVAFGQNIGEIDPVTIYNGNVQGILSAAGFAQSFACGFNYGVRSSGCMLPAISIGSYMGGGENNGSPNVNSDVWEYKADYQQNRGRHTLYTGFNIDTNNQGTATGAGPNLSFSPFQTSNGSNGGNELASFLLSLPNAASRSDTRDSEHGGYVDGFYAQDQWKVRDNLTVNAGIRYDVSIIPIFKNNKYGSYYDIFDFDNGTDIIQNLPPPCSSTQFAPCLPGGSLPAHVVLSSNPGHIYSTDWGNVQPRVGVSYSPRSTTVLHLSFGRVYDNWAAVEQSAQNANGWLMQVESSVSNLNNVIPVTAPTTAENPLAQFAGNYPTATPFNSIAYNGRPHFTNPYSDQWTVGIQQNVAAAGVWTVNYVGSRGRKLDYTYPANTAVTPGPGPIAPRTPFPYMQQSFYGRPLGQLDYNSLQTSLQGRSRKTGLTYLVSYSWSKGLNYGTDNWYGVGSTTSIENPYDFKNDRSVSGFDLPNVFTAGWTWEVPVGKNGFTTGNRIADYALGNWQVNGIATLESGRPYTVSDSGDIANTGNFTTYERPNQVSNPTPQHQTPSQWINPSAYAAPAAYTFGDTPRNSLRTEPYKNLDLSLFREFPFYEATKFQLRLDAFNSFNHPVWGVPNSCQNCANFGAVTSTINTARELQLSGKIVF